MKKQCGFIAMDLVFVLLALAFIGGWIANVFKLVGLVGGDISAMLICRIVGVFAVPFGSILGFL